MEASDRVVRVSAPAKVNLHLRILGREADSSYHQLETVFQAIDLCDEIDIRRRDEPGVDLEVEGFHVGPVADNLVMQAALQWLERTGYHFGVTIKLKKRIPAGTGLGGGSSDAAATLRALQHRWGPGLDEESLHSLGAELGSDVSFFLGESPTALAWGRGEQLQPLPPLPLQELLVVVPAVHVVTAEAYQAFGEERGLEPGALEPAELTGRDRMSWPWLIQNGINDFEEVVTSLYPDVAHLLAGVLRTGPRFTRLSGSGGAYVALYSGPRELEEAQVALEAQGLWVRRVRTLMALPQPRS